MKFVEAPDVFKQLLQWLGCVAELFRQLQHPVHDQVEHLENAYIQHNTSKLINDHIKADSYKQISDTSKHINDHNKGENKRFSYKYYKGWNHKPLLSQTTYRYESQAHISYKKKSVVLAVSKKCAT